MKYLETHGQYGLVKNGNGYEIWLKGGSGHAPCFAGSLNYRENFEYGCEELDEEFRCLLSLEFG
jgi:hypothetical protein